MSSEEKEKEVILKDYNTPLETEKVFSEIEKRGECSFQILCDNLSDFNQKIIGVSFSYEKNQAVYFAVIR